MEGGDSLAEQRARDEQAKLSARGLRLLTGGLTDQGDTFLIALVAVVLMAALYPLVGGWAFLASPIVLIGTVFARRRLRHR
jgi:hypothetical protein